MSGDHQPDMLTKPYATVPEHMEQKAWCLSEMIKSNIRKELKKTRLPILLFIPALLFLGSIWCGMLWMAFCF